MVILLTLEGKLANGQTQDSFFDYLKELAKKRHLQYRVYQDSIVMEVCPEGLIECSSENDFISIQAQTHAAGPGFHAYAAELYDDICMDSGLDFQVYDATGYYEKRDFEQLKQNHFYRELEDIIDYIKEQKPQEIYIAWPQHGYIPKSRSGYAVTLMGYIPLEAFCYDQIESLAERIYIWNNRNRDAEFYRNCAWCLLWKDCYYDYTLMNEESAKAAWLIVDYMDAAYRLDAGVELPVSVYHRLCNQLGCEALIPMREPDDEAIGYRKEVVYYPFQDWLIPASGCCECFGIGEKELILNGPYHNSDEPWNWMMRIETIHEFERIEHPDFRFINGTVTVTGVYEHGEGYQGMRVIAEPEKGSVLKLTVQYRKSSTQAIILNYLSGLKYREISESLHPEMH